MGLRLLRLCVLIKLIVGCISIIPSSVIKHLHKDLLLEYDTKLRPLEDLNQTLTVSTRFTPIIILELDTASQRLTFSGLFSFAWTDHYLKWNLTTSHGLDKLRIHLDEIWHPTVVMSISYNGRPTVGNPADTLTVLHTGDVSWMTEGVFTLVCGIDISFYPFDTQECDVNLYVSDMPPDEVLLLPVDNGVDRDKLMDGPEWDILDIKVQAISYFGTKLVRYTFLLRRRASFIVYTTIGPLIVLSVLNSFAFIVPIESGEKGSIVITLLLSFCVYISSITSLLPPNSQQNAHLLIFLTILEVNSAIAVLYTMLQSRWNSQQGSSFFSFSCILRRIRCCRKSAVDEISETKTPATPRLNEDENGSDTNRYKRMDTSMCVLFSTINIMVLIIFAFQVQSSFKESL